MTDATTPGAAAPEDAPSAAASPDDAPSAGASPDDAPSAGASPDSDLDGEGYDGPAELVDGDEVVPVTVKLRGHFDPISGKYSWYGRVAASPDVAALVQSGSRKVRLRTPHAEVETTLSDVDPWGRPRVEGFGNTPFEVLDTIADADG